MNTPPKLNDWALNVSQAYLMHHNPTTLHTTDTLAYSWKTMPFMTPMEVDDQTDWIPVSSRRRSKSPPTASINATGSVAPTISPSSPNDLTHSPTTQSPSTSSVKPRPAQKRTRSQQISWSQGLPPVTTVTEADEESDDGRNRVTETSNVEASFTCTSTAPSKSVPYKNVATNDGTHRVTVKWTPPERTHMYEGDKRNFMTPSLR